MDKVIFVNNICKNYNDKNVLNNVSFEASKGEILCLIGPSGCGKTTLLKIIGGFLNGYSGSVTINDRIVTKPNKNAIMLFKEPNLFPWRNVLENVIFPEKTNNKKIAEEAELYLDLVGLGDYKNYFPKELSTGMQSRASIARALIKKPNLLLMDEPFSSLDALNRRILQNLLLGIVNKTKVTIVLVTHDIEEALYLGDKIIVLGGEEPSIKDIIINDNKKINTSHSEIWEVLYKHLKN